MKTAPQLALLSPFESGLHDDADLVQARSVQWAVARGLVRSGREADKLARSQIGRFMALSFHTAERERLELVAQWTTLFCLLDDQIEIDTVGGIALATYFGGLLSAFRSGHAHHADVLEGALLDIRAGLQRLGSEGWVSHFANVLDELFHAFVWEQLNRRKSLRPSLQAYRDMRAETVGLKPVFTLGQLAEGCDLADTSRAHPLLSELHLAAARAMGWANDVCTYEKELAEGEVHNLVFVLIDAAGCPLRDAVGQAVAAHDQEVSALVELSRQTSTAAGDPTLARQALLLQRFVQGHLNWSELTARYRPSTSLDGAHAAASAPQGAGVYKVLPHARSPRGPGLQAAS